VIAVSIQKFEIVGGESWLSHNLGSVLIGLAAIVAAGVAAFVSIRNHKQQLTYDREIRDREGTRQAIDNAVRGMSDFILQGVTLSGNVMELEEARTALEEIDPEETDALARQQGTVDRANAAVQQVVPLLSAATNTIHADTIHLAIRVGKDHPLATTQMKTREALKSWVLVLGIGSSRNRTEEELEAARERTKEFRSARSAFETACLAWMTSGS